MWWVFLYILAVGTGTLVFVKGAERISSRAKLSPLQKVIDDYAKLIIQNPPNRMKIEDISMLPHPKMDIVRALCNELLVEHSPKKLEAIKAALLGLAQYQPNIGPKPLFEWGFDLSSSSRTEGEDLYELMLSEETRKEQERFADWDRSVKNDRAMIERMIIISEDFVKQKTKQSVSN